MSGLSHPGGQSDYDGTNPPLPSSITVTASPMTYQNTSNTSADVFTTGGTVSAVAFSRDNATFYTIGGASPSVVRLNRNDYIRVTYSVAPTMTLVPRA